MQLIIIENKEIKMIHPSYTELIDAINTNQEENDADMVLNSRYSLVLATSKRARQLIAGAKPLVGRAEGKKPLSIAIDELYQGKVKILPASEEEAGQEEIAAEEETVDALSAEEEAAEESGSGREA